MALKFLPFLTAVLTVLTVAARAEPVTVTHGGVSITGEVLGFDGTYLRLGAPEGEVTLNYRAAECSGAMCPEPEDYVPGLRLSGAARMTAVLLPALVEGYARETGARAVRREVDETHFEYDIQNPDTGLPLMRFAFAIGNTASGLADLIEGKSDGALADREIFAHEDASAIAAGLGRLSDARHSKILALDALIPVVSPRRDVRALSFDQLSAIYAGEITDWAELGGAPGPLLLHLPAQESGPADGVVQDLLIPLERKLAGNVTFHQDMRRMSQAVAADPNAIGIADMAHNGPALPLPLGGCGVGTVPTMLDLKTEDYALTQPLFLYLPERRLPPEAAAWIAWLRSIEAQRIVRRSGFVDRGLESVPLSGQGNRLAQSILAAGDEVTLATLQQMLARLTRRTRLTPSFRFAPGNAGLDAQSRANLLQLARWLRDGELDGQHLVLTGFSDGIGSAADNLALSRRRAESVRDALLAILGDSLPPDVTLSVEAYGEALPVLCDDSQWGRDTNRRVELWRVR